MPHKDEKRTIITPVTPAVHNKLRMIAQRTGNSMASIVRTSIDEYLQRYTPTTVIKSED